MASIATTEMFLKRTLFNPYMYRRYIGEYVNTAVCLGSAGM